MRTYSLFSNFVYINMQNSNKIKKFIFALGLVTVTGAVSVNSSPATQAQVEKQCVVSFCQGITVCDNAFSDSDVAADYLDMMESFCDGD